MLITHWEVWKENEEETVRDSWKILCVKFGHREEDGGGGRFKMLSRVAELWQEAPKEKGWRTQIEDSHSSQMTPG